MRRDDADASRARREVHGAADTAEVIFTRGTTEAINLVAASYGRAFLKAGDEIVISTIEHHANIVPWQMACEATGAVLKVIPVHDTGELDMDAYGHVNNAVYVPLFGIAADAQAWLVLEQRLLGVDPRGRHLTRQRRRVLVVEDEKASREALVMLLEFEGYDVRSASGGVAATSSGCGRRRRARSPIADSSRPRRSAG